MHGGHDNAAAQRANGATARITHMLGAMQLLGLEVEQLKFTGTHPLVAGHADGSLPRPRLVFSFFSCRAILPTRIQCLLGSRWRLCCISTSTSGPTKTPNHHPSTSPVLHLPAGQVRLTPSLGRQDRPPPSRSTPCPPTVSAHLEIWTCTSSLSLSTTFSPRPCPVR